MRVQIPPHPFTKMEKKSVFNKIEHYVDKSIPYLLGLLLIMIILELVYKTEAEKYSLYIDIIDYFIIFVFVIDLAFKYNRTRNVKKFLKTYWIEIIAILPFYFIFRILEEIGISSGLIRESSPIIQDVAHLGEGLKESKILGEAKEVNALSKLEVAITRSERFSRFLRPILRLPKFAKATRFYEKPHHIKKNKKN